MFVSKFLTKSFFTKNFITKNKIALLSSALFLTGCGADQLEEHWPKSAAINNISGTIYDNFLSTDQKSLNTFVRTEEDTLVAQRYNFKGALVDDDLGTLPEGELIADPDANAYYSINAETGAVAYLNIDSDEAWQIDKTFDFDLNDINTIDIELSKVSQGALFLHWRITLISETGKIHHAVYRIDEDGDIGAEKSLELSSKQRQSLRGLFIDPRNQDQLAVGVNTFSNGRNSDIYFWDRDFNETGSLKDQDNFDIVEFNNSELLVADKSPNKFFRADMNGNKIADVSESYRDDRVAYWLEDGSGYYNFKLFEGGSAPPKPTVCYNTATYERKWCKELGNLPVDTLASELGVVTANGEFLVTVKERDIYNKGVKITETALSLLLLGDNVDDVTLTERLKYGLINKQGQILGGATSPSGTNPYKIFPDTEGLEPTVSYVKNAIFTNTQQLIIQEENMLRYASLIPTYYNEGYYPARIVSYKKATN